MLNISPAYRNKFYLLNQIVETNIIQPILSMLGFLPIPFKIPFLTNILLLN